MDEAFGPPGARRDSIRAADSVDTAGSAAPIHLLVVPSFSIVRLKGISAHGVAFELGTAVARHVFSILYVHDAYTPKVRDELEIRGPFVRYRFEALNLADIVRLYPGVCAGLLRSEYGESVPILTSYSNDLVGYTIGSTEDMRYYGAVSATADFGYEWVLMRIDYLFLPARDTKEFAHILNISLGFRLNLR
ncbi:MAG: hypothetical protein GF410_00585 [Chitinivibrionales bacterium]|nr:hypothetical protein [Chitinivibrionales bacterium]